MSCRNCPEKIKPIRIRVPNYGTELLWFKAKSPFGEVEHISSEGKTYRFNEITATEAPAEFQKHVYTLELAEKPQVITERKDNDKKKGVSDDL